MGDLIKSIRRCSLLCLCAFLSLMLFADPIRAQVTGGDFSGTPWLRAELAAKLGALQREIQEKGYSFVVGYNPAMEYSIEEICRLKEPVGWEAYSPFVRVQPYALAQPGDWDWRNLDGVTPVRNQGRCGSCWAFSTVALIEAAIKNATGVDQNLSEQYLISCNTYGYDCDGGWFDAHDFHLWAGDWYAAIPAGEPESGAVLESAHPYAANDGECNPPHSHPHKLASWNYISSEWGVPSVQAIKQAIVDHGVVAAAVCVGSQFQAYIGGVFEADETSSCRGGINHAVALVGWSDDRGTDDGYWIVKNSWGTYWGEGGYMRIRYGVSRIGYAANYVQLLDAPPVPPTPPQPALPAVSVVASNPLAKEQGRVRGTFTVTRTGSTVSALTVLYTLGGTAVNGTDYRRLSGSLRIRAGASSANISVVPILRKFGDGNKTVVLNVSGTTSYDVGSPGSATVTIQDYVRSSRRRPL